ncbi:hypothetical protein KY359_02040 [Candidatus Woesearchaeota archaeon]|nr:hypothetical protein [Candidatus Woesearchaeota archaeon]
MLHLEISDLKVKSYSSLKAKLSSIKKQPLPVFEKYKEDVEKLKQVIEKHRKYKNLIVIGNGGSNTSFKAFHHALVPMDYKKKEFILTTMEPDLMNEVKNTFPRRKTLVMPISKSGTTIGVIESMLALKDYDMLPVTSPEGGALAVIAEKEKFDIIPHPPVGGRFSGLTASAFAPALFFGIDVGEIDDGARTVYKYCGPQVPIEKNPALQLAASLYLLEKKGYSEVFCPIYSSKLVGFENLIVQLMHESVCKKDRGQTFYCAEAPESQHHTNQRFFGGKKNVVGLFMTVENQDDNDSKVVVPDAIRGVGVRGGKLKDISNVPYFKALEYEFKGTYQDAVNKKIPVAHLSLDKVSAFTVGEFIGFWHYVAVYSSMLRDVDPYDQPQVESSKDISFKLRKEHNF